MLKENKECWMRNPCKYLNFTLFAQLDMKVIHFIQLDRGPSLNILNIGGATGLFSWFLWKFFGHSVDTSDILEMREGYDSHYPIVAGLLGVKRYRWRVEAYVSPPNWLGVYDAIIINRSVFNYNWTTPEHDWFLASLLPHVTPKEGFIFWQSNPGHPSTGDRKRKRFRKAFFYHQQLVHLHKQVFNNS